VRAFNWLGLPVKNVDGAILSADGARTSGVPVPGWQIEVLAATMPTSGRVTFADVEGVIHDLDPGSDFPWAAELTQAFGQPLAGADERSAGVIRLLSALGEPLGVNGASRLSFPQIYVLLQVLAHLFRASAASSPGPGKSGPHGLPMASGSQATSPCRFNEREEAIIDIADASFETGVGKFVEHVLEHHGIVSPQAAFGLEMAGVLSDVAEAVVMFTFLRVEMSIDDKPLIRTKDHRAGGTTFLRSRAYWFDAGDATLVNCFNLAMALLGVSGVTVPSGEAEGAEADFEDGGGFNETADGFVRYEGNVVRVPSDHGVFPPIGISGRPQKVDLPKDVVAFDQTATSRMSVTIREGFLADQISAASTALSFSLPRAMVQTIKRWKVLSFSEPFHVTDWRTYNLVGTITGASESFGNPSGSDSWTIHVDVVQSADGWVDNGSTVEVTGEGSFKEPVMYADPIAHPQPETICTKTTRTHGQSSSPTPSYFNVKTVRSGAFLLLMFTVPYTEDIAISAASTPGNDDFDTYCTSLAENNTATFPNGPETCPKGDLSPDEVATTVSPGSVTVVDGVLGSSQLTSGGKLFFDFECHALFGEGSDTESYTVAGILEVS